MKRNTVLGLLGIAGLSVYHLIPIMTPKLILVNEPTLLGVSFQYEQWGTKWSALTDCKRQGWIVRADENTWRYQEANYESEIRILQEICSTEDND